MQNYQYNYPQTFQNPNNYTQPPLTQNQQASSHLYSPNQNNSNTNPQPNPNPNPTTNNIPMPNPYMYPGGPYGQPGGPMPNYYYPPHQPYSYPTAPMITPLEMEFIRKFGCYRRCIGIMLLLVILAGAGILLLLTPLGDSNLNPENGTGFYIVLGIYLALWLIFYASGCCISRAKNKTPQKQFLFLVGVSFVIIANIVYLVVGIVTLESEDDCWTEEHDYGTYRVCRERHSRSYWLNIIYNAAMLLSHAYVWIRGRAYYLLLRKNFNTNSNSSLPNYSAVSPLSDPRQSSPLIQGQNQSQSQPQPQPQLQPQSQLQSQPLSQSQSQPQPELQHQRQNTVLY